jgi:hypothetical protein
MANSIAQIIDFYEVNIAKYTVLLKSSGADIRVKLFDKQKHLCSFSVYSLVVQKKIAYHL